MTMSRQLTFPTFARLITESCYAQYNNRRGWAHGVAASTAEQPRVPDEGLKEWLVPFVGSAIDCSFNPNRHSWPRVHEHSDGPRSGSYWGPSTVLGRLHGWPR